MGDAALITFPAKSADAGVVALIELKQQADEWFRHHGMLNELHLNAHLGPATVGPMGRRGTPDVIGHTVNVVATMRAKSIGLTPEVFARLSPENQQLFRHDTPELYTAR